MTKSQSSSQSTVNRHQSRVQVLHWQPARVAGARAIKATIAIDSWLVIEGVYVWEGRKREIISQLPANVHVYDPALVDETKVALDAAYYDSVDAVTLLLRDW